MFFDPVPLDSLDPFLKFMLTKSEEIREDSKKIDDIIKDIPKILSYKTPVPQIMIEGKTVYALQVIEFSILPRVSPKSLAQFYEPIEIFGYKSFEREILVRSEYEFVWRLTLRKEFLLDM